MPRRLLLATLAVLLAVSLAAAPAASADWIWPVRGQVITPYRNGDDPYATGQHRGIDIAAPVGTPVVAASGGEVRFAATAGSSGLTVSIRTADGLLDTSYLHLSSTVVAKGDHVSAGDRVGAVGITGKRSAAEPHLHFGIRDAGTRHAYHDPLAFLPPGPAAPERPRPAPAPMPAPAPTPRHTPVPITPSPEPAPERSPHPQRTPRRAPTPAPRPAPVPHAAPAPHTAPAPHPRLHALGPTPHPAPAPQAGPAHRAAPARHPARAADPLAASSAARTQAPPPRGAPLDGHSGPAAKPNPTSGPDFGYALACVGLLLAAAVLGLTEDGRQATRRSRTRAVSVLRPLLQRRS
jgi:hypothetical protein